MKKKRDFTNQTESNLVQKVLFYTKLSVFIIFLSMLLSNNNLLAAAKIEKNPITITGTVSDNLGPLPGVSIIIKGTTSGTITDFDGKYSLNVPNTTSILVFSYIGFITQEVVVENKSVIDITLLEDTKSIDEVLAVGYGTVSKKDVTGSVSSVNVKDAKTISNVSVNSMIQGRTSGVSISTRTAQPGGGLNIEIRGATSPRGSNKPLIVIDGVAISNDQTTDGGLNQGVLGFGGGVDRDPMALINPSDIESITILKDASSTAIYGSAAANGVILITTKKGKTGNVSVDYSGAHGIQKAKPYFEPMNAFDFETQSNRFWKDRYLYDKKLAPYSTTPYVSGWSPKFSEADLAQAATQSTDWLGMMLRDGSIDEHNVSITGGAENVKTFASFNYYSNNGLLKNSNFKRYTGRLNVDYDATKWLSLGIKMSYTRTSAENASTNSIGGGVEKYNQMISAIRFPSNVAYDAATFDISTKSPYDPQQLNPAAFLKVQDVSKSNRFLAAPSVEFNILPGLKFKIQEGIDVSAYDRNSYYPASIKNFQTPDGYAENSLNVSTRPTPYSVTKKKAIAWRQNRKL